MKPIHPPLKTPLEPAPSLPKKGIAPGEDGQNLPVEMVTWDEASQFCELISKKENRQYRLATEAEWEFVYRAGSTTRFWFGEGSDRLDEYAWTANNSGKHLANWSQIREKNSLNTAALRREMHLNNCRTHPVGTKPANPFSVRDMEGNVTEWCADFYGENYFGRTPMENPQGPGRGELHVAKGCNVLSTHESFQPWRRWILQPDPRFGQTRYDFLGFRVVLDIPADVIQRAQTISNDHFELHK